MARFCLSTEVAPIQWCLYHGETETGITTMLMDDGYNTAESFTPIHLLDNAQDLAQRLAQLGADLLWKPQRTSGNSTIPQEESQATYAPLIQKQDYCWTGLDPRSRYTTKSEVFFQLCYLSRRVAENSWPLGSALTDSTGIGN